MYDMFLEEHDPDYVAHMKSRSEALLNHQKGECSDIKPVITEHFDHNIFVKGFNIHFGFPLSDTYDTSDSLRVQIEMNRRNHN